MVLVIPSVMALELDQETDTVLVQDTIIYNIKADTGIREVELLSSGIEIDGNRLITIIQGGTLNITFTEWSVGRSRTIHLKSSVPQTLTFKWIINGTKHYFKDDVGLHLDTYRIGMESVEILLVPDDSASHEGNAADSIESAPWLRRNVFFVVLNDEVIHITNSTVVVLSLFAFGAVFVIYLLRRNS